MPFVSAGKLASLPPGSVMEFMSGEQPYAICNWGGTVTALNGVCPHRGGPLGQGIVEGAKIVCPWHGWEFDLATGNNEYTPNLSVSSFELKVDGESVYARIREELASSQD
jgi:nitrite reductase (NADH) small subunit